MLAYSAHRPTAAARQSSPNALLFIISAHVAVAAVVMSLKMDLPHRIREAPIPIINLPTPQDPAPIPRPPTHHAPAPTPMPSPVPIPLPHADPVPHPDPGPTTGTGSNDNGPTVPTPGTGTGSDPIKLAPVRHEAYLLTPPTELKPPYPASKLASEEEATLHLRLTIDDHGRVVAVDPVGRADPIFVAAARRHLIAHWRYAPASIDGQAVATSLTITLRFLLDG